MKERTVKLYYCDFCTTRKRYRSFRMPLMAKHEAKCMGNPNRQPQIGELTFRYQMGEWDYGGDREITLALSPSMPPWWPGVPGMIYTGDKWMPVEGYRQIDPVTVSDNGPPTGEEWPVIDGKPLPEIKPWTRRLYVLPCVKQDDLSDEAMCILERYDPPECY